MISRPRATLFLCAYLLALALACIAAAGAEGSPPRPDPHPSAHGKRITIVHPDGVYVCGQVCITIDLAQWARRVRHG